MNREPIYQEKTEGPTPNGGSYSIAYYFNNKMQSIDKEAATRMIIVEYDEKGQRVAETYAIANNG